MAVKREVMQLHQVREPLANDSTPTISSANTQKSKQKKKPLEVEQLSKESLAVSIFVVLLVKELVSSKSCTFADTS